MHNRGKFDSHVPVQVYAVLHDSGIRTPRYQLCGLKKVFIAAGESRKVDVPVDDYWLKAVDENGTRVTPNQGFTLYVSDTLPNDTEFTGNTYACIEGRV